MTLGQVLQQPGKMLLVGTGPTYHGPGPVSRQERGKLITFGKSDAEQQNWKRGQISTLKNIYFRALGHRKIFRKLPCENKYFLRKD